MASGERPVGGVDGIDPKCEEWVLVIRPMAGMGEFDPTTRLLDDTVPQDDAEFETLTNVARAESRDAFFQQAAENQMIEQALVDSLHETYPEAMSGAGPGVQREPEVADVRGMRLEYAGPPMNVDILKEITGGDRTFARAPLMETPEFQISVVSGDAAAEDELPPLEEPVSVETKVVTPRHHWCQHDACLRETMPFPSPEALAAHMAEAHPEKKLASGLGERYGAELKEQQEAWAAMQEKRLQEEEERRERLAETKRRTEEAKARRAAEEQALHDSVLSMQRKLSALVVKVAEQQQRLEPWQKTAKEAVEAKKRMELKVQRRRAARAAEGEFAFGPSMVAHRLEEMTGRSDWAGIVRKEGFDGLDVMDLDLDDVMSMEEHWYRGEGNHRWLDREAGRHFLEAVVALRDRLTQPVAELVSVLRDGGSAQDHWFEAQEMLKAGFAIGAEFGEPVFQMVNEVSAVAKRFRELGDRDVRTRSVVDAIDKVLSPAEVPAVRIE